MIYIEECPYNGLLSDLKDRAMPVIEQYFPSQADKFVFADFWLKSVVIISDNKDIIDDRSFYYERNAIIFIKDEVYLIKSYMENKKLTLLYPEGMSWRTFMENHSFEIKDDEIKLHFDIYE